jgi:hypothetical protein
MFECPFKNKNAKPFLLTFPLFLFYVSWPTNQSPKKLPELPFHFSPTAATDPARPAPPLTAHSCRQAGPAHHPLLTVYFGTPSMFITLWFGFDYGTNPPLGILII